MPWQVLLLATGETLKMLAGPGEAEASHPPAQAKEPAALVGIKRHGCDEAFRHKAEVLIAGEEVCTAEQSRGRGRKEGSGEKGRIRRSSDPLLSPVQSSRSWTWRRRRRGRCCVRAGCSATALSRC